MATNRDLLKEAIADAKAVKETAIANAKAALEEAFTPYLKEKLSAKLQEMDMEEEADEMKEEMYDETEEMSEMKEKEDEGMYEEVSLDELLAELDADKEDENLQEAKDEEKEEEEMSIEDMSEDDLKSFIEDVIKDMVEAGELEAGHEGEEGEEEMDMEMEPEAGEEELDEEISIDELLAELEETSYSKKIDSKGSLASAKGKDEYVTDKTEVDDAPYSKKDAEEISFEEDLKEAYKTIETLKSELNEINLLNAKLLYTNKIFRNKSLTETQKVKVLTAFDKATTKQEAQLVYETLIESLKASATKAPIKESLSSASKVLGGNTSKPIIENDAFSRMRELAFGGKK